MLVCVSSEYCASLPRCIFSGIKRVTQSDPFLFVLYGKSETLHANALRCHITPLRFSQLTTTPMEPLDV